MKTNLIVWIVGLLGLVAGFLLRGLTGNGPDSLVALCGLLIFAFLSGALLIACENGKYMVHSSYLFLVACVSLIGFVI